MSETKQDQKPVVDADLMQTNAMQAKRIEKLEAQLKLAVDALAKVNDQKKAQDAADKQDLIDHIVADSHGKLAAEVLKDMDMRELKSMKIMADALGTSQDEMFASVAALQTANDKKHAPLLTAGAWDAAQKKYVGGL